LDKERICCVCRIKKPVNTLSRVARIDGKFVVDTKGNANGRGCYVCKECLSSKNLIKGINRSYKSNVGAEIAAQLTQK